ncbi:MAG: 6-bladed beta-propeller [bacterium]
MRLRIHLFALSVILFFSCSRSLHPSGDASGIIVYPKPPDTTRIQFLTRVSSSNDVSGERGGFKRFILGKEEVKGIGKPHGVNIFNGKIYICDPLVRGFEIIDLKKSTLNYFSPVGLGELKTPLNCIVDKREYLYVADGGRKQIVVFNEKGKYYTCFGEKENFKPTDIVLKDDKIWVTNLDGHQINVFSMDSTHRLLTRFPAASIDSAGYLYSPVNLFVTDSLVYVTDLGDFKIKKFTREGKFVSSLGSYGLGIGQFTRPKGIAVDREENLYVVDAGFENVQMFDKHGKLLMFFGGNYKGPGDMWLPAKVTIDYENLKYFEKYVDPGFNLKYLILVTNQFGPDKLNIYGAVEPMTPELKAKKKETKKK